MRVFDLASGALLLVGMLPSATLAQVAVQLPAPLPRAVVNLRTADGAALVRAQWRYRDISIVEVEHREPGPDLRPSGAPNRTNDIAPHAGAVDFDDSAWEIIEPATLEQRRSHGRLAFNWYRTGVTIPERVGDFQVRGATVILELVVDDYAEIWVDGRLPLVLGQAGGQVVKGFNAPNRVVLARDARPGQQIQLAIFGINGPLSSPPPNFIWLRSATLDFYRPGAVGARAAVAGDVVRLDPALDGIVPRDAAVEKLATGFGFTEGPVWSPEGYLLFSDPNDNLIYRWTPDGQVSVHRTKSGYAGMDIGEYRQPGSNGLALDRAGRLTIAEHGNRRITRIERNGVVTVLADRYDGRRLNSPNDLVYRSDGSLYFTDPPFGLPNTYDDARRELGFSGIFRWADGRLDLLATDLKGPNGIAFSPDERHLYVANWDTSHKVVMRYEVTPAGTLRDGRVFADLTSAPGEEALDGVKVDRAGHVFVSGPGGVWIFSPAGRHLGTIRAPELPANMAWGDADGRTLYLTGRSSLYRIRLKVPGAQPVTAH